MHAGTLLLRELHAITGLLRLRRAALVLLLRLSLSAALGALLLGLGLSAALGALLLGLGLSTALGRSLGFGLARSLALWLGRVLALALLSGLRSRFLLASLLLHLCIRGGDGEY